MKNCCRTCTCNLGILEKLGKIVNREAANTKTKNMTKLFSFLLILLQALQATPQHSDVYHERLHLTPLVDGRILTTFQFVIETLDSTTNNYDLFPKSLGQVLVSNRVRTLSLVLTKGAWDRNAFGDLDPFPVGPPGAELRATFWNSSSSTVSSSSSSSSSATTSLVSNSADTSWTYLKAALGGMFCASLSTIDDTTTIQGTQYVYPDQYHGILNREMLCTENLAPLIKLLPCRSKAGLAALLEPTVVFESDFTSIGLEVVANEEGAMTMTLTTTMVLDRAENILQHQQKKEHKQEDRRHCPQATSSIIQLNKPTWGELHVVAEQEKKAANTPAATTTIDVSREPDDIQCEGYCWLYHDKDVETSWSNAKYLSVKHARPKNWQEFSMKKNVPNPVNIRRTLTGTGRVKGGLITEITNIGKDAVNIQYLDILPWYLQLYTHTLKVTWNENIVANGAWRAMNFTSNFQVRPTYREGPFSTMECTLLMAPGDVLRVEIQFLLVFLQFEQFPPDANRGFDIPSAIIQVGQRKVEKKQKKKKKGDRDETTTTTFTTMYTSSLMIEMPYPDFSMPYNVITLTSTLMAFVGGTVLNMLSRKWKPELELSQ